MLPDFSFLNDGRRGVFTSFNGQRQRAAARVAVVVAAVDADVAVVDGQGSAGRGRNSGPAAPAVADSAGRSVRILTRGRTVDVGFSRISVASVAR